jgi:branched-chain amino acid transport system substrate-binding protein
MMVAGIAGAADAAEPIKFGFITELSGAWSFFGTSCTAGMQLAEKEVNAAGGALGRPLQFMVTDDQTNPAQAAAAVRSADAQQQVLAISGPTSSDTALAIYGYAEQNKLPFMVPVAAFPQLTKPGTHETFRLEPSAVGWGYSIAKYVEKTKPGGKVAILYSDFALMRAIAAGLKYQVPKSGLTLVSEIVFPQGSNDATVQAAQVVGAEPDYVVVIGAGGFDNTITNQLLDLGVKPEQIIHPYGITTQVLGWGKPSVGSIYGTFFDHDLKSLTTDGRRFVETMTKDLGRPPSYTESFCYDVPYIFKQALDKAGAVDREKFRDALSQIRMQDPMSGVPIEFDKNGARKEFIYFMRIDEVTKTDYKATQIYYNEWDPEVVPVYDLVK